MKIVRFYGLLAVATAIISCGGNETSGGLEQLKLQQGEASTTTNYTDSIQQLNKKIASLSNSREAHQERIAFLTKRRDSVKGLLLQIESSLEQLKSRKIDPGINGVNAKLDELKGQKENFQEQQELQQQELALAEKKKTLLAEEKGIYDAQRQALYDKGAAPAAFGTVDSLLSGINDRIAEQATKIKNLNRNTSDILESVTTIDAQRKSLSDKIRNNYTAQEIFDDFSKEERARLTQQLKSTEEELATLLAGDYEMNTELALNTNNKEYLESKQNSSLEQSKASEENRMKDEALAMEKSARRQSRIMYTAFGLGAAAIILFLLYMAGKKRKKSKSVN